MNFTKKIIGLLFIAIFFTNTKANAQQEGFLGEIRMFAGNFAPRGWAFCEGQLLPINNNQALFSILGTMYGGDGRTTFGLPDLRGRVAISAGRHPGSNYNYREGQMGGAEQRTLNTLQLPQHNHSGTFTNTSVSISIPAINEEANSDSPTNNVLAIPNIAGSNQIYSTEASNTQLKSTTANIQGNITINNNGGSQPIDQRQPYTVVRYIIALQGIFPSRN